MKVYWGEKNVLKDARGTALIVTHNFVSPFSRAPAVVQPEMPPLSLQGSRVEEAERCEWQGGTLRVTAESKQPRWASGDTPAGRDSFPLPCGLGARLLGDGPVTTVAELSSPRTLGKTCCPVGLDQPCWERWELNSCLI